MNPNDSRQLAEELHARRRDLDTVVRAIHRLLRYTEPQALFEAMARIGADALGTTKCSVFTIDEERNALVFGGSLGLTQDQVILMNEMGISLDSDVPPSIAVREQRPVQIYDVETVAAGEYEALRAIAVSSGIRSALYCPIVAEGVVLGLLTIYSADQRTFHPDEVRRLSLLAEICAVAVHNARDFTKTRQLAEELETQKLVLEQRNLELNVVAELAPILAVSESRRAMLGAFHRYATSLVQFEQIILFELDPENRKDIVVREVFSSSPTSFNRGWRRPWDGTIAEGPMIARKPFWHNLSPGNVHGPIATFSLQIGLKSLALFPLTEGREVIGTLCLGSVRIHTFNEGTVSALEAVVAQLAGAMAKVGNRAPI